MAKTLASPQRAQGAVGALGSDSGGISKFSVTSPTLVVSNSNVVKQLLHTWLKQHSGLQE